MKGISAVIKQYNGSWQYKPTNHIKIYDRMMKITDGDHEISDDAASWCETACIGDVYEFREGIIKIEEVE